MIQAMQRIQPILQHPVYRDALRQIEQLEQNRKYCKHGLPHLLDVARIAALIAVDRGAMYPRDVIYAAALLHDLGRCKQYTTGELHAQAGVRIAQQILQETDFTEREQEEILQAVGKHQCDNSTEGLAHIIFEADHISRMCFACPAADSCYWAEERRNRTVLL